MTELKNYKKEEQPFVDKALEVLQPFFNSISSASPANKKGEADKLFEKLQAESKNDPTGRKFPTMLTLVAERFYDVGSIFDPSDNDKENMKTADYLFGRFGDKFIDYAFDRVKIPELNERLFGGFVVALSKQANADPVFRAKLIAKIDDQIKEKELKPEVLFCLRVIPLIGEKKYNPLLLQRSNDKTIKEEDRLVYKAALGVIPKKQDEPKGCLRPF